MINKHRYKKSTDWAPVVIIGNGIAGMTAALEARHLAPELPVTLITRQSHPTVNTPGLRQYTMHTIEKEQLLAFPPGTEGDANIEMLHAEVTRIDAIQKSLTLAGGKTYEYESLLLATGSKARQLPHIMPGHDLDGAITLHRLQDYLDLRRRLHIGDVQTVAVIGGGIHASDTVMSLMRRSLRVHWLLHGDRFYANMLDKYASNQILEDFREAGAQISLNTELLAIVGKVGSVSGIVTTQHAFLPCNLVLVCIGSEPVTTLVERCNLPLRCNVPPNDPYISSQMTDGPVQAALLPGKPITQSENVYGIQVDQQLRTSVASIFAAGDVAAVPDPLSGKNMVRGQWASAIEQGKIAGAMLVGQPERIQRASGVFWHVTAIGSYFLVIIGAPLNTEGAEVFVNHSEGDYRRITVAQNQLTGYLSLTKRSVDNMGIKQLIEEGTDVTTVQKKLLDGTFDGNTYHQKRYITRVLHLPREQEVSQAEAHLNGESIPSDKRVAFPIVNASKAPAPTLRVNHETWPLINKEVHACIGCNECLFACPALSEPISINLLNKETLAEPQSPSIIRFARACYQCGACVDCCPVGLHRDAMMLKLKVQLLQNEAIRQ